MLMQGAMNTIGMRDGSEDAFGAGYNVLPIWKDRMDSRTRSSSAIACCRCSVRCDCVFVAAISGCANTPPDTAMATAVVTRSLLMGTLIDVAKGSQLHAWATSLPHVLNRICCGMAVGKIASLRPINQSLRYDISGRFDQGR